MDLEMGHMDINLIYRLLQRTRHGNDLCLLQSEIRVECLRLKAQLLKDNPARFTGNDLHIRTYHRTSPEELFGEGIYG